MTEQPLRLPRGGAVDREQPLTFQFDGRQLTGYVGDTLASALLANGRRLVGRGFKYHRPRGIFGIGSEEPNALVTLGAGASRDPNVKATTVPLFDGLEARSQNRWPSLATDFMALNGLLSPLFVAGFYYKTFKRPASFWRRVYEPFIRRAAGLGEASREPDPDTYARVEAACDVLVVGAGAAGLEAATTAAKAGADVMLVEERPWLGGQLAFERETVDDLSAADWLTQCQNALAASGRVRVLTDTVAFGLYDGRTVGLLEYVGADEGPEAPRQRSWTVRARQIVLATGALEQAQAFTNNDRPGVMLAGAARGYVNRFATLPGRRTLIVAGDSDGTRTARDLVHAGAAVAGVVDTRTRMADAEAADLAELGIPLVQGACVHAVHGRQGVRGVSIGGVEANAGSGWRIPCDAVAVAGGWQPAVHLQCHLGGKPSFDAPSGLFLPPALPAGHASAGACRGVPDTAGCRDDGRRAGAEAAIGCGYTVLGERPASPSVGDWGHAARLRVAPAQGHGKRFVDMQHDVTVGDIELAHREGYRSVEHLKRYTTLGMATDQGKSSNILGLSVLARLRGVTLGDAGTTTFRPPYLPATIGALAGEETGMHLRPHRESPTEPWHRAAGATMVPAGLWQRPRVYPGQDGDLDHRPYVAEAVNVRERVGIVDVSTLGKIELIGPDAATVVDRLYCNGMRTLKPGKARYGVMLRPDGLVLDDGTLARLGEERYLLTTTTANAARVLSHVEFLLETNWCELRAAAVTVSDHWAGFAIAGPRSRSVLSALFPELALDDALFPFLGVRWAVLDGVDCLIMRNSFSGERAYEVLVPADFGTAFWRGALSVGAPFGLRPYGTEAMGALRIEKGHVAGPELDGRVTPGDLGLGRMVSRKKAFVGSVLRHRPALNDPQRPRLVGLQASDRHARLRAGALLRGVGETGADAVAGHISSVTYSAERDGVVALGMLQHGPQRHGETIEAFDPMAGRTIPVRVCAPVFVDPEGTRLHA